MQCSGQASWQLLLGHVVLVSGHLQCVSQLQGLGYVQRHSCATEQHYNILSLPTTKTVVWKESRDLTTAYPSSLILLGLVFK